MTGLRVGSLCSGTGALDLAVLSVLGGEVVWHAENDPAAAAVFAHHWPSVPNLGDLTTVDWTRVEPVDVLTAGFPCQDVSAAGRRAGLVAGTRSGLWLHIADIIDQLRPPLVLLENVRGLLSAQATSALEPCPLCVGDDPTDALRALGAVVGDLSDCGYDAQWCGLRAADVGAPHGRFRVFVLAWPTADASGGELQRRGIGGVVGGAAPAEPGEGDQRQRPGHTASDGRAAPTDAAGPGGGREQPVDVGEHGGAAVLAGQAEPRRRDSTAADPNGVGSVRRGGSRRRGSGPADDGQSPAGAASVGRGEGRPEPTGQLGGSDAPERGDGPPADPGGAGRRPGSGLGGSAGPAAERNGAPTATDTDGGRCEGSAERNVGSPTGQRAPRGGDAARRVLDWGTYEPAIRRWERLLGRGAPEPTVTGRRGGQQLNPVFVEWLMGLDAGWVTGVPGLSRNDALRVLGNGVVPQQAAAALCYLLAAVADLEAAS